LPYFKCCEDNSRGPSTWRGVGGPLTVSDLADPNPLSRAFVEAAVKVGIRHNDDYNGATQDGVRPPYRRRNAPVSRLIKL
jgi:choline dehydrogenase